MTIKNKLIVGFSIILLIMAYVGWNGLMSLGRLNERLNEVVDVTSEKVKLGARINRNIVAINRAEKDMILANNVEKINFFTDIIENLKMEIRDSLGKLDKLADEQGQQDLAKFRNVFEDYLALVEEVRQLTLTDISTHSQRLSQRDAEVILNEIMSIINKVIANNQTLPEAPNQVEKLNLAIQLATHMLNLQYQEKNIMLAKTVEDRNSAIEQVEQLTQQLTIELKQLQKLANAKEQELITALRTHYKNYIDLYQKIIELDYNEGNEQATVLSTGKSFELINQAEAVMKDIVDKNDNEMVNVRIATDRNYATSRLIALVLMISGLVISVIMVFFLLRSIMKPINQFVNVIETVISTGNFNLRVNNERSDEIGRSARALDALLETTETAIAKVLNLANSVVKAINEIAQGSQNLSQRTQEQASALEETASSMEQMTATVGQNSERAKQANHVAIESRDQTDKGVTVMSQTIDAMRTIQDSSKQIEEIVSLIDGIAFQINLLALNAAVEAARAGEHGRGFAVVAGEVRSLAQKSAEAAKDIKTLINSTVKQIENGTHLVDETGSALNSINTAIKRVGDIIAEISSASAEQRVGIEQVNKAIVSMDEVTQQNASLVEEMAAAATTMKDLAYEMKQAISFFQVQHTLLEKVEPNEMNASESLSEKNTIPHYAHINKENHNNPEWEHF